MHEGGEKGEGKEEEKEEKGTDCFLSRPEGGENIIRICIHVALGCFEAPSPVL